MVKKLLEIFNNEKINISSVPPIWLMRQAGRYLPEYRALRTSVDNFLSLCYNPNLAATVTLQPIKRFAFDGAIIFSDILVIADSLNHQVTFKPSFGPQMPELKDEQDLLNLTLNYNCPKLANIHATTSLVKAKLDNHTTLISFAGAPWTVAAYMLAGRNEGDNFYKAAQKIHTNPNLVQKLIEMITELTIEFLSKQIEAGAEVIQLFDSWAGILDRDAYFKFVINPTKNIFSALKSKYPHIPLIGFPRKSNDLYYDFIDELNYNKNKIFDCLALDQDVTLNIAQDLQKRIIIQGNLNPEILLCSDPKHIIFEISKILEKLAGQSYIFNLGHGILPNTPIENVELLIDTVRNFNYNQ